MNKLPFGFDQPEDSPGFLLWQTTMVWQRQIKKALEEYAISHPQFVIMAMLLWFEMHKHEVTQAVIIDWSKLDKMTVSKALKQLSHQDLVKRLENKSDSRAKNAMLTKKGKELVKILVPIVEDIDNQFFNQASHIEQKSLIKTLRKLTLDLS